MKAPNKYFIHSGPLGLPTVATVNITGSDIEYIRKDALLEWAKNMKEANDGVCDTSYYKEFIDKINSM